MGFEVARDISLTALMSVPYSYQVSCVMCENGTENVPHPMRDTGAQLTFPTV